jgi:hypothetical protein
LLILCVRDHTTPWHRKRRCRLPLDRNDVTLTDLFCLSSTAIF